MILISAGDVLGRCEAIDWHEQSNSMILHMRLCRFMSLEEFMNDISRPSMNYSPCFLGIRLFSVVFLLFKRSKYRIQRTAK